MKQLYRKTLLALGTFLFSGMLFQLRGRRPLISDPDPVDNYDEAVERIKMIRNEEKSIVREENRTVLLTHDKKTKFSVILIHGYTNCPQQFGELGALFFEKGCNVIIPRMPRHGLPNPYTKSHAKLTASSITAWVDSVVDIAKGFGDKVVIIGISAGGTIAGWVALSRKDVHHCVLISPVFGYHGFPQFFMRPLMHMLLTLPNFFKWWDTKKKGDTWKLKHGYPRYASRTLGELLRLGFEVRRLLNKKTISRSPVTLITNENDDKISNEAIYQIRCLWRQKNPGYVFSYEFSQSLGFDHDIIDPEHENQHIERVYPVILDLIPSGVWE